MTGQIGARVHGQRRMAHGRLGGSVVGVITRIYDDHLVVLTDTGELVTLWYGHDRIWMPVEPAIQKSSVVDHV